ncbi:hypothetical protein [Stratiformator vulcanicus]|uniref:Uncharacterized protein n=1 Tax=Stratiformator vulcanicus TaxID=2527980 RepID=A0A517QZT5_9PLAN|nr:hypothetical protein [Stratiformator vulcanicus]QDT37074.1 hypothetical protein Pan189_14410 [Stratiformator vulcanicus]
MSTDQSEFPNHFDDVDWRATQYVLGELGAEESKSLEDQLGHDQELREAVARATQLTLAIAAVRPMTAELVARRSVRSKRSLQIAVVGTVAALALVMAVAVTPPGEKTVNREQKTEALLALWAESRVDDHVAQPDAPQWERPIHIGPLTDNSGDDSLESDVAPPNWMLAAVSFDEMEVGAAESGDDAAPSVFNPGPTSVIESTDEPEQFLPPQTGTF